MRTSTNLGLSLPDLSDYINAKRDISDNMEIIDDAFTISDITSQLTYSGVSYSAGGVYKIGKLIIVQLRVLVGASPIPAGIDIIKGLPTTKDANGSNITPLSSNCSTTRAFFVAYNGRIRSTTDGSTELPANSSLFLGGCYLTDD